MPEETTSHGVVVPLSRGYRAGSGIPRQRFAEDAHAEVLASAPDGSVVVMSLDGPERFFRGLGNALWMSTATAAVAAGALRIAGVLG